MRHILHYTKTYP
jgi:hypothetical protein